MDYTHNPKGTEFGWSTTGTKFVVTSPDGRLYAGVDTEPAPPARSSWWITDLIYSDLNVKTRDGVLLLYCNRQSESSRWDTVPAQFSCTKKEPREFMLTELLEAIIGDGERIAQVAQVQATNTVSGDPE